MEDMHLFYLMSSVPVKHSVPRHKVQLILLMEPSSCLYVSRVCACVEAQLLFQPHPSPAQKQVFRQLLSALLRLRTAIHSESEFQHI